MQHRLDPKYQTGLAQLEHLHPSAFRFLRLVQKDGPVDGLWLSTATNAHLYKGAAYLMHIKLRGLKREPGRIVLSPTPHIMIDQDATDRSELMFPRTVRDLVIAHGGFKAGWAPRGGVTQVEIELTSSTPDSFFDALLGKLRELDVET